MDDVEIREFVKANTAIGSIEGCVSQNMTIGQLTELVKKALEREQPKALDMHGVIKCPNCFSKDIDKEECFCKNCNEYTD